MIGLSYLSLIFLGWLDNGRSPFFPDILQNLGLTAIQGSLFFAITSLFSYSTGFFNDRLLKTNSSLHILQMASIIMGLGYWVFAAASSFPLLVIGSVVFGMGYGVLTFVQNVIIQEWAPAAYRRRIFIGLHSMYGIASLLAPLSASAFLSIGWSYHQAYWVMGALPILLGIACRLWFQSPPARDHSRDVPLNATSSELSARALWGAALSVAFYMFGEIGVSTRLVLLLRTQYGESAESANTSLAVFFVLMLIGRLFFAAMDFRRLSNRRVMIVSASLSSALVSAGLLTHHPSWLAFSGLTMAPFYPVGMNFLAESFGPQHAARVLSFGIALCSLAVVALQMALGVLTNLVGLESAMWMAPLGLFLSVVLLSKNARFFSNTPKAH